MRGLSEKTALVTGGTGLIGGATCVRLAEEGARVVVASRSYEKAEEWCSAHQNAGTLTALALDVSSAEGIAAAFDRLRADNLHPTILVATAIDTRWHATPFERLDYEHFAGIGRADVAGNFLVARRLVDDLRDDESASIVLFSSIYGSAGVEHSIYPEGMMHSPVHYSATKAAVQGVTRWLAGYWGARGIRVNAIVSGGVRDENRQGDEFVERYNRRAMLGRMGYPREIASAAAFLASDDASYITGTCLDVEGGLLAW
ncbi:MAG TPA: SDR family oxidoreductase [Firmicutes bacterium]|nr:SDR family oxidoreductase [Bacillota bacterium]